jgi:hypothetical protein
MGQCYTLKSDMMKPRLEINIIYRSSNGREATFTDIKNGTEAIDIEEYEPKQFWLLMGGFQVTLEKYKTIFRSSDFHYLVKATSFLIYSLYWIKGEVSEWFDKDDMFSNDVVVRSTGGNLIRLQSTGNNTLTFSYIPKEPHSYKRGERFFEAMEIEKALWFQEADIALSEYFEVLLRVVRQSEASETSNLMLQYYGVWKALSALK